MFRIERHGLGFTKIQLRLFGYSLRLHIWHGAPSSENRHNHGWTFMSIPLLGTFADLRWRLADQPGTEARYVWSSSYQASAEPTPTGHSDALELASEHIRWPLVPYVCRTGEIHSYYPRSRRLHASLVLVGRVQSTETDVWPMIKEDR